MPKAQSKRQAHKAHFPRVEKQRPPRNDQPRDYPGLITRTPRSNGRSRCVYGCQSLGCDCPDKLMSLKQQARLRSLRVRAEHNLQEKWQEKRSKPQCPSRPRARQHRWCRDPLSVFWRKPNLDVCNPVHTTQMDTSRKHGSPWRGASHGGSIWGLKRNI